MILLAQGNRMQLMYPYFLTIHLICAIIFLGFIFTDVFLLTALKKSLGEKADELLSPVMKRGVKIMPICVLLLVISGGAMMSSYLNSELGFFNTNLQKLLMIKIILALIIVLFIINALVFKLMLKRANPIKSTHSIVLVLSFITVVLAKMAFFV